jgi:hypothetical protein
MASDSQENTADILLAQRTADAAPPAPAAKQPATTGGTGTPTQTAPRSDFLANLYGRTAASEPSSRLAGTPNMFGDSENGGHGLFVSGPGGFSQSTSPLAGGSRDIKIAENDNCLPQNRVFFLYNHFQDADSVDNTPAGGPAVHRSIPIDRYTIGFEKTFCDGLWSYELRMPFSGGFGYQSTDFSSFAWPWC